jgi:hypothetical protein
MRCKISADRGAAMESIPGDLLAPARLALHGCDRLLSLISFSSTLSCNPINLNFHAFAQNGLNRRAGRTIPREMFSIDTIEGIKVLDILQMASALDQVVERATSRHENLAYVLHRDPHLFFDRLGYDLACIQVHRALTADVQPAIAEHTI